MFRYCNRFTAYLRVQGDDNLGKVNGALSSDRDDVARERLRAQDLRGHDDLVDE
jgi:hypothetical protein